MIKQEIKLGEIIIAQTLVIKSFVRLNSAFVPDEVLKNRMDKRKGREVLSNSKEEELETEKGMQELDQEVQTRMAGCFNQTNPCEEEKKDEEGQPQENTCRLISDLFVVSDVGSKDKLEVEETEKDLQEEETTRRTRRVPYWTRFFALSAEIAAYETEIQSLND